MPGSSRCSALSSVACSLMVRVSALTCGSIVVSLASKARPGKASTRICTAWPTDSWLVACSGRVKLA